MKTWFILGLGLLSTTLFADGLPVFTLQPANQLVTPTSTVFMTTAANEATAYQWRYNGVDIPWGTGPTLKLTNVQASNSGYYLAVAKNATGWVPSQMAYLAVVDTPGLVPLSNLANSNLYNNGEVLDAYGDSSDGVAHVFAGPQLDQMALIPGFGNQTTVSNGYFNATQLAFPFGTTNKYIAIPSVVPGQTVYYSVYVTSTNSGITYTQQSTVLNLTAGGENFAIPSTFNLKFPVWLEWPEPNFSAYAPTQRVAVPGETLTFSFGYFADDFTEYGFPVPTANYRKDGGNTRPGSGFTETNVFTDYGIDFSVSFTITNVQPNDAGVYDAEIFGDNWCVSPKLFLSVQTTNGSGVFQSPQISGTNFICNLAGAATRNYQIQWSTNLANWNNLTVVSNLTGTVTFTNSTGSGNVQFYRSQLLP